MALKIYEKYSKDCHVSCRYKIVDNLSNPDWALIKAQTQALNQSAYKELKMIAKHIKPYLLAIGLTFIFGISGCSSSSSSSGSGTNALPSPSVNCDGSSCVD